MAAECLFCASACPCVLYSSFLLLGSSGKSPVEGNNDTGPGAPSL